MNQTTVNIFAFIAGSILVILLSWRSLGSIRNHGFFRFFAWELMLWLLISNVRIWFRDPFSVNQIISWILLMGSVYPVLDSLYRFRIAGHINRERNDPSLFGFEHTTRLITSGVFRYIRHPMYASLLYLNWGIALKALTLPNLLVAAAATLLLYLTVRAEERENMDYFGDEYRRYMKRTKRFVPLIW
jgi:protein-S-isoprenylcysteine O-methyltransferase Ste14